MPVYIAYFVHLNFLGFFFCIYAFAVSKAFSAILDAMSIQYLIYEFYKFNQNRCKKLCKYNLTNS